MYSCAPLKKNDKVTFDFLKCIYYPIKISFFIFFFKKYSRRTLEFHHADGSRNVPAAPPLSDRLILSESEIFWHQELRMTFRGSVSIQKSL